MKIEAISIDHYLYDDTYRAISCDLSDQWEVELGRESTNNKSSSPTLIRGLSLFTAYGYLARPGSQRKFLVVWSIDTRVEWRLEKLNFSYFWAVGSRELLNSKLEKLDISCLDTSGKRT